MFLSGSGWNTDHEKNPGQNFSEVKVGHVGSTICSGSSDTNLYSNLLYKMGHYFLDILYYVSKKSCPYC